MPFSTVIFFAVKLLTTKVSIEEIAFITACTTVWTNELEGAKANVDVPDAVDVANDEVLPFAPMSAESCCTSVFTFAS